MWWLDPGKELLQVLFNRILAPYVENLDLNQVNYGIAQGQLTLRNLRLKKEALDKFQLPLDVAEGRLGKFTLSLYWMNLGNRPVEILIEDVYLLVVPSPLTNVDPAEEEARTQAAKLERLENAELLQTRKVVTTSDEAQSQGLWESLITKVINNIQITIKNVHVRYEDNISVPGRPFTAGLTLTGFTAVSVNDQWQQAFIESTAGSIRKLATLSSLALYFDTDTTRLSGLTPAESARAPSTMILSEAEAKANHQFILKPVSGDGRITINHKREPKTPRYDVQLLFDEIGVALDEDQYRDVISLVDMYHVFLRKRQYRRFRRPEDDYAKNPAQEGWRFAITAVSAGIKEKRRKWSWPYFAERRDDRNSYVSLFQRKLIGSVSENDLEELSALERKLSYEDLRFYRSIARSKLRSDETLRKKLEAEREEQQQKQKGWTSWLWGSTTSTTQSDNTFGRPITTEQRKQLYEVLDYDEKAALADSLQAPSDSLKARILTQLRKGSMSLILEPHGRTVEIVSVVFGVFQANYTQRPDNFEVSMSLENLEVSDRTTKGSIYPQIVQVKSDPRLQPEGSRSALSLSDINVDTDAFFYLKYENNPPDRRADNALTVRMRHMEIIYHKGYVEAIYKFFKPPASQLESVGALLDAASQTLEGIRKETRAVLEYALQTHKTIDVQMDLNAPIIVVPEDITTNFCKHLIIDAGHIAVESKLADKKDIRAIEQKRQQSYSEDDYRNLESLMYDKFMLRLEAAQFVIGDNLQSCLDALTSSSLDTLHLLERTNINLQLQSSIVPNISNLSRFKISGVLPHLKINFSDYKYKALMRIIDVCIPKFDDGRRDSWTVQTGDARAFLLAPNIFGQSNLEYYADEGTSSESRPREGDVVQAKHSPDYRQALVEVDFRADILSASLAKADSNAFEVPLGDVTLNHFALRFSNAMYDMKADLKLRSLSMTLFQPGKENIDFVSSPESDVTDDKDLLNVGYTRVQKDSPNFMTTFEGFEQVVDVRLSTFIFKASPEPLIAVYDFIMSAFVSEKSHPGSTLANNDREASEFTHVAESSSGRMRIKVQLDSVRLSFIEETLSLATLSLSTAIITVVLERNAMQVSGRLGNLKVTNDDLNINLRPEFQEILSIEGQNFADFSYQKFDSAAEPVTSYMKLNAASVRVNFVEGPLHELFLHLTRLKKLYDAASQVAVQQAPTMERMKFEISIKSPIIVLPSDPIGSLDKLVLRLGEVSADNTIDDVTSNVKASLSGIQLLSEMHSDSDVATLKIVDNIDINANVSQFASINRSEDVERPDIKVTVKISDVRLYLTQIQYCLLVDLTRSISRIFGHSGNAQDKPTEVQSTKGNAISDSSSISLEPELKIAIGQRTWTSVDLVLNMDAVRLHLYDAYASSERTLKDHGIARFSLSDVTLRLKTLSDGSLEAQATLRSFTVSNTRPGNSRFKEIIPAATHSRNQFTILYTTSGEDVKSSLAILTIETPKIIFAVDPVIAMLEFFTSPFQNGAPTKQEHASIQHDALQVNEGTFEYRIDLHDASISVLENDADPETQAIELTINQVLLSQQGILALKIDSLGMSLTKMGRPSEKAKFMDDVDITMSLDNRSTASQQLTNIEIHSKNITFRASYRDIILITSILNRAMESYGHSQESQRAEKDVNADTSPTQINAKKSLSIPTGKARVTMIKEQLNCSIDGFSLFLIGDLYEQPLLHFAVKPFILGAQDWSGELRATTTVASHVNYWNLTNSHWEPLIDPWTLTFTTSKDSSSGGINYALVSRERLDLNVTVAFIDLVVSSMRVWSKEGAHVLQKSRGEYAPYRIQNRTGCTVYIWSDSPGTVEAQDTSLVKLSSDEVIDWRFDDWRTTREHVSSFIQHSIGLRFHEKPWSELRHVPLDQEGEYTFLLRAQTSTHSERLLCEIKVVDSVKLVTLRSTYKIENNTLYPLELMLVNDQGEPLHSVERLAPDESYPVPIDIVAQCRVRLQPDQGFGYKWCQAVRWEDLMLKRSFTLTCRHADSKEAPFRIQASVQTSGQGVARRYTKVNLRLCAPLEIENLLPYNLDYRIYDKDTNQTWMSYLRKGGVMPVHSVELGHLLLLNVTVQDTVFKPSDFTIINPGNSEYEVENHLLLQDSLGRQLRLRLNYLRHPDSGGAFKAQIYSPYIVVNKTGLPFRIRSVRSIRAGQHDAAGEHRTEHLSKPTPFLLSHFSDEGHEFILRVGESTWSKLISLDAPSAEVEVVAPSEKRKAENIHIGLSWYEGSGKYKMTKVITLSPRFLLKNGLSEAITFREHGSMPRDNSTLEPGASFALRAFRADNDKLLTIAYPGLDAQWSPPFNIADIGVVCFRLRRNGTSEVRLIRAEIQLNGATIFISISHSENQWPFRIENETEYTVRIRQTSGSEEPYNDTNPVYTIPQRTVLYYAWDYPAAKDKRIQLSIDEHRRAVDLHEIGDLMPFKFYVNQRPKVVAIDIRADGHMQILRITPYRPERSKYKPRRRSGSTLMARTESISSSSDIFEAVPEQVSSTTTYAIDFAGIGVSVIDKKLVEVLYVTVGDLKFEYATSPITQSINLSCGTLQVDNQLHDALFPVVLQPTPIPKSSPGVAPLPTIQASLIWLSENDHGVLFVKYCSVLLQALTIEADEDLLFSLYELMQIEGIWEDGAEDVLIEQSNDVSEPPKTAIGQYVYFEILEFQPIMLSLSFMRTERVNSDEQLSDRNPLAFALNALTMIIGNVNDAPVMMNALAFKDIRLTVPELRDRVLYHYRQDILRQLYRILGSADFIGNPVGLFNTVSSGVADIFYEPFRGVVMRGNKEFGIGLAKGAASFVKKTVFGLTDSVTKFTSSVGKGLSAATFDSEYQARRRLNQRRNKPRHAIYGVAAGGEALASSMTSAVEGIIMKPIEGAETEGAVGFFKGIGKGLVGAVTKPVVGVFDLASNVSEGIRNTTTVFDNPEKDRVRMPRLIPADNVLRPYSSREALGQFWMKDLNEGAYRREHYVAHILLSNNVVLLTTMRVLAFRPKKLQLIWELPFTEVQNVTVENAGIRFMHKSGKERDKYIPVPDKESQSWLFGEVASVVKSFNAKLRMES